MRVAVMNVGIVGMPMGQRLVLVRMHMRLRAVPCESVLVLVMLVMPVSVHVGQRNVGVLVIVSLPHVQPYAHGHQRRSDPKIGAWRSGP